MPIIENAEARNSSDICSSINIFKIEKNSPSLTPVISEGITLINPIETSFLPTVLLNPEGGFFCHNSFEPIPSTFHFDEESYFDNSNIDTSPIANEIPNPTLSGCDISDQVFVEPMHRSPIKPHTCYDLTNLFINAFIAFVGILAALFIHNIEFKIMMSSHTKICINEKSIFISENLNTRTRGYTSRSHTCPLHYLSNLSASALTFFPRMRKSFNLGLKYLLQKLFIVFS